MKEEQATGPSHPCVLPGKGHLTQQHTQEVTLAGRSNKGRAQGKWLPPGSFPDPFSQHRGRLCLSSSEALWLCLFLSSVSASAWIPPPPPAHITDSKPLEGRAASFNCVLLILPAHRLAQSKQVPTSLSSNCPVCSRSPFLQEKRMSKATEVMMQYVENLKRTYEKDHAELMEFKKLANQNPSRSCGPSGKELGSCPHLGPAVWVPDGSRPASHPSMQPEEF